MKNALFSLPLIAAAAVAIPAGKLEERALPQGDIARSWRSRCSLLNAHSLGIDVSAYQPNVNWNTVKSNGVSFAYIKATEGTSTPHSPPPAIHARAECARVQPTSLRRFRRSTTARRARGSSAAGTILRTRTCRLARRRPSSSSRTAAAGPGTGGRSPARSISSVRTLRMRTTHFC
jgi:hypothetical protein